jgi:hypothetical protein
MIESLGTRSPKNLTKFRKACRTVERRIAMFDHFTTIDEALSGHLFTPEYIQSVEEALSH